MRAESHSGVFGVIMAALGIVRAVLLTSVFARHLRALIACMVLGIAVAPPGLTVRLDTSVEVAPETGVEATLPECATRAPAHVLSAARFEGLTAAARLPEHPRPQAPASARSQLYLQHCTLLL